MSDDTSAALLRWSAIFGGLLFGLALLLVLSALWLALAYGSHMSSVADTIECVPPSALAAPIVVPQTTDARGTERNSAVG